MRASAIRKGAASLVVGLAISGVCALASHTPSADAHPSGLTLPVQVPPSILAASTSATTAAPTESELHPGLPTHALRVLWEFAIPRGSNVSVRVTGVGAAFSGPSGDVTIASVQAQTVQRFTLVVRNVVAMGALGGQRILVVSKSPPTAIATEGSRVIFSAILPAEPVENASIVLPNGGFAVGTIAGIVIGRADGTLRSVLATDAPVSGPLVYAAGNGGAPGILWYRTQRGGLFRTTIGGETTRMTRDDDAPTSGLTMTSGHAMVSANAFGPLVLWPQTLALGGISDGSSGGAPVAAGNAVYWLQDKQTRTDLLRFELDARGNPIGEMRTAVGPLLRSSADAGALGRAVDGHVLPDAFGNVAFATSAGIVGVLTHQGSLLTLGGTPCGPDEAASSLVSSSSHGFFTACADGRAFLVSE